MTQIKMLSTAELKAKNKEGTPYALIFNHGTEQPTAERYATMSNIKFSRAENLSLARQNKELERGQSKRLIREQYLNYNTPPESKLANAYMGNTSAKQTYFTPNFILGPSEPLPTWNKKGSEKE